MRRPVWRVVRPALCAVLISCGLLFSGFAQGQVVLPITVLNYEAPVLPPQLWPTSHIVTRDLALLPAKSLEEKRAGSYEQPYRVSVSAEYRDIAGTFGRLNLGAPSLSNISLDGDAMAGSIDISVPRDDVALGARLSLEDFDLQSASQQRLGIMPYGRWLLPLNQRSAVNLVGTLYYFANDVESRMSPRSFSDYDTLGASVSAALHFDTRQAYTAVSVGEDAATSRSLFGSIAATFHIQSDDAKREVLYQGRIVEEVDDQRLLIFGGNIGSRLTDRTTVVAECEYAFDLSDYDGSLTNADDHYGRVAIEIAQLLSPRWRLRGGVAQTFGHEVETMDIHITAAAGF